MKKLYGSNVAATSDDQRLHDTLMMLQCELVAQRQRVNPKSISWLQYDILSLLRVQPALPSQLSDRLAISRSKLSKNLTQLRGKGYVIQTPGTNDRRRMVTALTDEGKAFLRGIDSQHDELTDTARHVWSKEQQRQFAYLATSLIDALAQQRNRTDDNNEEPR